MLLNILKAGESSVLPGAVNLIRAERGEKTCRIFRGVDEGKLCFIPVFIPSKYNYGIFLGLSCMKMSEVYVVAVIWGLCKVRTGWRRMADGKMRMIILKYADDKMRIK